MWFHSKVCIEQNASHGTKKEKNAGGNKNHWINKKHQAQQQWLITSNYYSTVTRAAPAPTAAMAPRCLVRHWSKTVKPEPNVIKPNCSKPKYLGTTTDILITYSYCVRIRIYVVNIVKQCVLFFRVKISRRICTILREEETKHIIARPRRKPCVLVVVGQ